MWASSGEERNFSKASNTRLDAQMIIFISNTHINLYWGKCVLYLGEKRDGGGQGRERTESWRVL